MARFVSDRQAVRTVIVLVGQSIWSTESFDLLTRRVELARESASISETAFNPLGPPLVMTEVIVPVVHDDAPDTYAATRGAFNPMQVLSMYESVDLHREDE